MDIEKIIDDLGANYRNDEEVLRDIVSEITSIASNISNRETSDEKLFPYIKKTVKAVYLCRGAEGLKNKSESGISDSFEDIIDTLRNDIVRNGLRRIR